MEQRIGSVLDEEQRLDLLLIDGDRCIDGEYLWVHLLDGDWCLELLFLVRDWC